MSAARVSMSPWRAWCLARRTDMHRRQFMAAAAGGSQRARSAHACRAPAGPVQSNRCGGLERRAAIRATAVRQDRLRRARQRRCGAVPARLPAQQLPVARRVRSPRRRAPLRRGGLPRPGLHRGRAGSSCAPSAQVEMLAALLDLAVDPDGRPRRQRQRRRRRAAVRPALSRSAFARCC